MLHFPILDCPIIITIYSPFLEGVITAKMALKYVLFSNAGDEEDTVLNH